MNIFLTNGTDRYVDAMNRGVDMHLTFWDQVIGYGFWIGIPLAILVGIYLTRNSPPSTGPYHKSAAYKQEFSRNRRVVLNGRGRRCSVCGSTYQIHVHHRLARARGGSNSLDNLQVVCKNCHKGLHRRGF